MRTFPTAASPRSTNLTLLLGLGAFVSAIVVDLGGWVVETAGLAAARNYSKEQQSSG